MEKTRLPIPAGLAELPPGPELAAVLAGIELGRLGGLDCVTVMRAQHRQVAHEQARLMAAMVEVACCGVGPDDALPRMDAPDEFSADEIRGALVWTRAAATAQLSLAWDLRCRLPEVFATLERGAIDVPKAKVFSEWTCGLTDAQAEQICASLLPRAPELTTGQLTVQIKRLAIAIDPGWARRRYFEAVRERKVVGYRNEDGSANVCGYQLPADRAAAACAHLDVLAKKIKHAGDGRRIDLIRADLYLAMLDGSFTGRSEQEIIAHILATAPGHDGPGADHPVQRPSHSGGGDHGEHDADAAPADDPAAASAAGGQVIRGPWPAAEPYATGRISPDDHDAACNATRDATSNATHDATCNGLAPSPACLGPGARSARMGACGDAVEPPAAQNSTSAPRQSPGAPGSAAAGLGTGDQRVAAPEAAANGDRGYPTRPGRNDASTPAWFADAQAAGGGDGRDAGPLRRAGVEIRVEITTLLGVDEHPGEIAGWGFVDAEVARGLVREQTDAEWRYAITDDDGHLRYEGITRRRPDGYPPRAAAPCRGGIVELHIKHSDLHRLAARARRLGAWATIIADVLRQADTEDGRRPYNDQPPAHEEARRERSTAGVRPTQPGRGHDKRGPRSPGKPLRRRTEIRDRTCTHPRCRTPARGTDGDHIQEWARGGVTDEGNIGSACRHDHRLRHEGGWQVVKLASGEVIWISRLGVRYRVQPPLIIQPLPDPIPRNSRYPRCPQGEEDRPIWLDPPAPPTEPEPPPPPPDPDEPIPF